jgi:hypothetical protein
MKLINKKKQKKQRKTKKTKKNKKIEKMKKNKTLKQKTKNHRNRGGTILGKGKDGCIIDSISCGKFSKENGYVAKILYNGKQINKEVNDTLARLDPNNERYNRYFLPELELDSCLKSSDYNEDILKCTQNGSKLGMTIVFERKLNPFDNKKMTKAQYRYLRESLKILHANNISHGDLPDNVMIDPTNNMPIIIDWEEAKTDTDTDTINKEIDMNAFLDNYKVSKIT